MGTVGRIIFIEKDFKDVQQAHYSILQHLTIMTPLVNEYLSIICAENNGCSDDWIMREHKRRLTAWLKDLHLPSKGMILTDIYSILPPRTEKLCPRIVVFVLRP